MAKNGYSVLINVSPEQKYFPFLSLFEDSVLSLQFSQFTQDDTARKSLSCDGKRFQLLLETLKKKKIGSIIAQVVLSLHLFDLLI